MDVHDDPGAVVALDPVEIEGRARLPELGDRPGRRAEVGLREHLLGDAQLLVLVLQDSQERAKVLICSHGVPPLMKARPAAIPSRSPVAVT